MNHKNIKVTLTNCKRGFAAPFQVTQIQNAIVVEVPAGGARFDEARVGDYIDEAFAKRISNCVGVEVTVKL